MDEREYDQKLSAAATMLAGEVPAGKERDYLIELSRRFKPKPTYPDGQFARVTYGRLEGESVSYVRMVGGEWTHANGTSSYELRNDVTKVEPLRVLGDDEIAVKRVWKDFGPGSWRAEARNMQPHAAATLCNAYADALEAEAES